MGRSRVHNSTDDDPHQRSKRRKPASTGDNSEAVAAGQGTNEGKKALYHCNYCNKDISGKIRIKCTKCPDFDLCVECFSVGAEVTPHKSNHPYRVMDNLSFPLICPDWNADEEILLLEGIEMYGLGNWTEVAEHVGTKNKAQCIDHYTTQYMNSPCYPLPDMSHVVGKNRKELLAMAKVHGFPVAGDITPKEESPFSPSRVKLEDLSKDGPVGRSPSSLTADGDSGESKVSGIGGNSMNTASTGAGKKASNMAQFKGGSDGIKVEGLTTPEDSHMDRSVGGKKPKYSGYEGPSMTELSGYNPKRQEFDPEYDNDAEQSLAEMEFKDSDSETDRQLKLRMLHIYLSRLDERKRRKDFILERNLLYPNPLEKELSNEDREIYERYKVFMRFHSQEEHDALLQTLIEERNIRKRIKELQEYRAAGCRTMVEVEQYEAQKRKRESEANALKAKESGQLAASGKVPQRANRPMNKEKGESDGSPRSAIDNHKIKGPTGSESGGKDSYSTTTVQAITKSLQEWEITGLPGAELLSETEQQLCSRNKLMPSHYLKMQEVLTMEMFKGTIVNKSDAYRFFKVDPTKVDQVYDMVIKKGLFKFDDPPIL
ncbi:ADA2 2B isoform X2 [Tasmannia lanceolata]|uniref:ADA2 2B isoform X2 n=1 Tax=Tasmannia lanceolata TaxID=3420 RepID=UPI004064A1C1